MQMMDGLKLDELEQYFIINKIENIKDGVRLYVHPVQSFREIRKFLARLSNDFDIELRSVYGEFILELKRRRERIWINIVLLIATIITTTVMGAMMYERFDIIGGFIFSLAVMFVLGTHEMGHYLTARKWGMKTSLPYFIPFPTIIGTLGAVIRHRGAIPNRKALFDVGSSGPIVGIVASIIVIVIGLQLEFIPPKREETIILGTPILFDLIINIMGYEKEFIHPVVFAGWVGLFITFLNLIPVGQLDGGHILRAMIGKKAEVVSRIIPILLMLSGFYIGYAYNVDSSIWIFWGFVTLFFSMHPHPEPIDDKTPIDLKRKILGIFVFLLAFMCFTPVPFQLKSI